MLTANGLSCYAARVAARALDQIKSKAILAAAGVPVTPTEPARTAADAITIAARLGFPVALKLVSPDIVHKSDADGVRLGLDSPGSVRAAFDSIMAAAHSALLIARPEIRELDLNPVLAYADRVVAVDARVLLEAAA